MIAQEIPTIDWDGLQETKPWLKTEVWSPVPDVVTPGYLTAAPSDAIVLFDGTNLDKWQKPVIGYPANMDQAAATAKALFKQDQSIPQAAGWIVKDGVMIVKPGAGAIETKQDFGSCQLHVEWLSPTDPAKEGQMYSNSGVFLMKFYEVQVLNSYENKTYPNGQAGSLYKQHIPLVNASRPSGEWQSYDIIFDAPIIEKNKVVKPAKITVLHNGVLIQNGVELLGPTIYFQKPYNIVHPGKLPIVLQDHGDMVRFRNIWIREL